MSSYIIVHLQLRVQHMACQMLVKHNVISFFRGLFVYLENSPERCRNNHLQGFFGAANMLVIVQLDETTAHKLLILLVTGLSVKLKVM